MSKSSAYFRMWFIALLLAVFVSGCTSDGGTEHWDPARIAAPATLSSITVTPAIPSVPEDLTKQFKAIGIYSDGTSRDITALVSWSSGTVAVATLNPDGTAGSGLATGVSPGTSTITAALAGKTGSTALTVTPTTLSSIAVTPANPSVADGLTRQFTATGTYSDGTSHDITAFVTWTSGTTAVATMNANGAANSGLATGVSAGTSTITAALAGRTGSTTLTVTAATLSSIAVTPVNPSVADGLTRQFTATGTYSDGTSENITAFVTWSSGTSAVATMNTNGAANSGLATGVLAGTSTITAALAGRTGSTTLTVTPATLSSIAVTPANPSVVDGLTRQFTATGTYSDGTSENITAFVTWSSGTTGVAIMNPNGAANSGLATGVSAGTSTITAALAGRTGSTTLTVTAATLSSIAVTPANPSVVNGLTRQFTATGTYSDGTSENITDSVIWSSGSIAVATMNPNGAASSGLATGLSAGTSTITAALAGRTGSTTLTVTAATLSSITVTPANPSVVDGLTRQFTATGTYSDGTSENITASVIWSSGSIAVATMNANGAANSGLATGVSAGTSTITAALAGRTGSTTLTVTAATLSSIAVTPANPSVVNGQTRQFMATGTYSDGTSENITASVIWTSGTIAVATMNPNGAANSGLATGVSAGTSTISAALGGRTGSTTLTVTAATLSSIAVTPANPSVVNGQTRQFTATGTYSDGTSENITDSVIWSSGTITVATMNANGAANSGLATGVSPGTSTITAALAGRTGSTTLTVTSASLSSIVVTPANPSVVCCQTRQFWATGNYSDGTSADITASVIWTSGTTAVATMNPNGSANSGLATGVSPGTSTITAALAGRSGSTTLTVTSATLSSIAVTPANPSVVNGQTRQFTATGTYSNGSVVDITASVIWTSGTIAVATMNPNGAANSGLATGVSAGTSTITATLAGRTGSTTLTVTSATLSSIAVTPLNPSVVNGQTRQFAATGTYSNGSVADITASVIWTSGTIAVATLNPNGAANSGLATGVSAGNSTITAALAGRTGSTTLTVTAATLSSIAVTPTNPSILNGQTKQFKAIGTYADATTADITASVIWSSGTIGVATLNPNGAANSGLATGVSPGNSTITAALAGRTGSTVLAVTAALANNPTAPNLGETERFVMLSSQAITTTSGSAISNGDLGILDQARSYYAGFTVGATAGSFNELTNGVSFAPDDTTPPYAIPVPYASTVAFINQVRTDLGIAYTFLAADPNPGAPTQVCPIELGNQVLTRGVYKTGSNVTIQTGALTLDGEGDANSVWIFSIGGTLTTGAPGGNINLVGGAQAKNVFWRTAGKTTIGTNTIFQGNVFSWPQVNVRTDAAVTGRLLSVTEQVTLESNNVTAP